MRRPGPGRSAKARRPFLEKLFLPADVRRLIDELLNGNSKP
jgi:hypothetical protein